MFTVELANLKKHYGSVVGVEDVSFNLVPGEVFGFIGPNGAGKSTAIRIIMGLLKQDEGLANILNKDCFNEGHEARDFVGYVPSEVNIYPRLTVRKYLEFIAKQKGKPSDRITDLCKKFELNQNRLTHELSMGNKKKVGIVAAVLGAPKVLVFDEPTTGLDPIMQQRFFELVEEEKAKGVTILLSSHNLSEVQRCCDRAGIIKSGKIVAIKEVSVMKERSLKHIEFEVEGSIIPQINYIDGIENLEIDGVHFKFSYNGKLKNLIHMLNGLDIKNISITDATLDDEFIRYYQ